jgi:hypothetical protein
MEGSTLLQLEFTGEHGNGSHHANVVQKNSEGSILKQMPGLYQKIWLGRKRLWSPLGTKPGVER